MSTTPTTVGSRFFVFCFFKNINPCINPTSRVSERLSCVCCCGTRPPSLGEMLSYIRPSSRGPVTGAAPPAGGWCTARTQREEQHKTAYSVLTHRAHFWTWKARLCVSFFNPLAGRLRNRRRFPLSGGDPG